MINIRLQGRPRRAWLTSFGLVVSGMILLGFVLAASYHQSMSLFGGGACLTVALVLSASLWPWVWTIPYRAWNKMGRHYGEIARFYLLGLCYVIVSAIGVAGPSKDFTRNARSGSGWIERELGPRLTGEGRLQHEQNAQLGRGWIRAYTLWAMRSGQLWRLALLPFLILLSTLDLDEESHVPTKTYTLF